MKSISQQWLELAKEITIQTIEHWRDMIKWAKGQNPKEPAKPFHMENAIGQSWLDKDPPLCHCFAEECLNYHPLDPRKGDICKRCPLYIIFGGCSADGVMNAWKDVALAKNWEEWLEGAEIMLEQLKVVLMFLEEDGI